VNHAEGAAPGLYDLLRQLQSGRRSPRLITRRIFGAAALAGLVDCGRTLRKRIGVIPKANADLFFLTIHAGADRAARDLKLSMIWSGPDIETDYSRQIEILDAMLANRVSALAISATDDRALAGPIERIIRAGIPVTIFDSAANVNDYVSLIATDNHEAGCTAARRLAALLPQGGPLAMLMQKPGGTSTELRERGFEETVQKEFPKLAIVARQYGMGDRARSMSVAEDILTAHPNLAGIFASSEACSIGAIRAIRARHASGRIRLITFDTSDIHIQALRDGTADIMLVQDAYRIGYETVKSLGMKLAGKTPPRHMEIMARVITKANLDAPDIRALLNPALAE
jgi:ribose transport system substrate-binding protein